MKVETPTFEEVSELAGEETLLIPSSWEDYNGHVNIQYYMSMYESGGQKMMERIGMDDSYFRDRKCGVFDLEHHVYYLSEVHVGETVSIHSRVVAMNEKRFHGFLFILNQSTKQLASTLEYISASTDLKARRTAPFPADIAETLQRSVESSQQLTWAPPLCGCMSV